MPVSLTAPKDLYDAVPGLPAHSLDAEEALLGSFMIDPDCATAIVEWLPSDVFYRDRNRFVYRGVQAIVRRGEKPHQIALAYELAKTPKVIEAIGGVAFLSWLIWNCPTSVYAESYANILLDAYKKRVEPFKGRTEPKRKKAVLDDYAR